jgi:hypothetical protein
VPHGGALDLGAAAPRRGPPWADHPPKWS